MTAFMAAYRNEWHKLIRRRKYTVFLIVGVAFCLLWTGMGQLISKAVGSRVISLALFLTPTPMGALPLFLQVMIPLLMFMGVTDLLTVEGAEHTMKAALCRPVERWKLYAAKILAVETYAALYLVCLFIVSALLSLIFGKGLSLGELFTAAAAYALTLVPLAVLASFGALIALLGASGTLTMFLLLLLYMTLHVLPVLFPLLNELLFTSFLGWYRLWIGALPGAGRVVHMLVIVLGYGVVFFMGGSLLFDRKEY